MMRIPKGYLTMDEVAKRLGVHRATVFRMVKGGRLRTVKRVTDRIVAAVDVDCLIHGIRGKAMNTKKRVGIYARVSTAGQDTENQLLELRRYCAARGWEVMEYKDEGLSGTLNEDKRPALRQLMQDASRRKITAVVAWDFSRLARSLRNLLDVASRLNEAGCALVTLRENVDTETANGRLMLGIFGSLAEFERELIRERILLGLKKSKALGRVPGPKRAPVDLSALRAQAAAGVSCRKLGALFGVSKDTARNLLKAEPLLAS